MLKNYLKIAFRNLIKYPGYSVINIFGLSTGIACCILIMLFVGDELSYDRYHEKADRIYRIQTDVDVSGNLLKLATTSFPMAEAFKTDYSEIEKITRVIRWGEPVISKDETRFKERNMLWADTEVFEIFSWAWVAGDPKTALKDMYSVVLTESTAKKYFGDENPIGKTIRYEAQKDMIVRGVIHDIPANSHIKFDLLGSAITLNEIIGRESLNHWHAFYATETFVLFQNKTVVNSFEQSLPKFVDKYLKGEFATSVGRTYTMSVAPLTSLHLSPALKGEFSTVGSMSYIYTFSAIAFGVLFIACINFMNLSTARSARRAKEIGLRKVLGALKKQLIRQFLGETFLLSFVSIVMGLILVEMCLPAFNQLAGKQFTFDIITRLPFLSSLALLTIFISLLAGFYPAIYLSKLKPVDSLKNNTATGKKKLWFRHTLVSLQFAVSVILIVGTIVVYGQLKFIQNQDLGLDKSQVLVLPVADGIIKPKYNVFRDELLKNNQIQNVAISTFIPGGKIPGTPVQKIPTGPGDTWEITTIPADYYFVKTMGIKIVAGRDYSKSMATDMTESMLINESAAKEMGWTSEEAIGKNVAWGGSEPPVNLKIIGVMKDFNYASLHTPIKPILVAPIDYWPGGYNYVTVRISEQDASNTIDQVKTIWGKLFPETPFIYSFMDDDFAKLYASEDKLGQIFLIFAIVAILIACLGLLGLAAFLAQSRTKEIGIRKVVGANSLQMVSLLLKDFLKPVLYSTFLSWPMAYFIMTKWLENFAYRSELSILIFMGSTFCAVAIAIIILSYHAIKASRTNPAHSLKYE